ncbi:phospholipase C, phosphocholine-specific [Streptomyces badius]
MPLLVVSPWTVGGYVCSEVFDHTSVIRFLERWTGVEEPNIGDWRRRVTGDLTSAFDFTRARRQPAVQSPGAIPPFEGRWQPKPPAVQHLPEQEPGVRPARPLPYRPDAQARRVEGGLRVELENSGRSSAHFALYPYAGEFPAPQHKDVRGRAHWTVPVPGEAYRFTVTGPNGFRREFAGPADGGAEVAGRIDHRDRDIHLTLRNTGRRPLTFLVRPLGYVDEDDVRDWTRRVTVKPGRSRSLVHSAADAHGWYDLDITVDGEDGFRRRLMGHIENGRASVSG